MKLVGSNEIDWNPKVVVPGFAPESIFFGQGNAAQAMQIAAGSASTLPTRTQLRSLYSDRKGKLPISLMLAVEHGDQISIFGPDPDAETLTLRAGNAINFLNAVLAEPEESLSYQRALSIRRSLQTTDISGFTNNGLFASHYIRTSAPSHPSWNKCLEESKALVDLRHMQLIEGLGFEVTSTPANTHVLRAKGQDNRVVAVLLDRTESFDGKSPRFQASPVEWGLNIASSQGAPWLIALRDSQIRLYPAKDGVGVGQKSQVETYFEIDLLTIDEDKAALLPLIFSAEALSENGTADELLRESQKFAAALGTRLRERVYESIVPPLATEIANQLRDKGHKLDTAGLQLAYGLTLRVLFRLLFQAYAEDRGLLPAGRNERFDKNSLKDRAKDLIKQGKDFEFGDASSIWFDHMQIWDAIDQGSPEMQIPAYNGGLFGIDEKLHPEGFLIRSLSVPDRVMGPALRALVIDDNTEDGVPGMVDFRSLSVREFGTIYEGLLESSLSVAEQDLTVDKKGAWVPAKKDDEILAKAGEVYFHSASGERKSTGSYYTPSFVVDHLIERSVEPALKNHLEKVKEKLVAGDQAAAYDMFFDFRVADLAMGSGHFLVAAIDKIETVMRAFLLEPGNEIEGVEAELKRLEEAAKERLGVDEAAYAEIERASLLRRQIARRCIYGLDINPLAVELTRLAIWIHTFVPGLPMSSLEHGLVCANSLTGIASAEEGMSALTPDRAARNRFSFCDWILEDSLTEAKEMLEKVAETDEATKSQAKEAAEAHAAIRVAAQRSKVIFDLSIANRSGVVSTAAAMTEEDLNKLHSTPEVQEFIQDMNPAHMPYLFPEVFLRENPGFDVLVGNPPWEELVIDSTRYWASKFPGLLALNVQERDVRIAELRLQNTQLTEELERTIAGMEQMRNLLHQRFPMGVGHSDLYKAFGWVALNLVRSPGGYIGFVFPKTTFSAAGMQEWRESLQSLGSMVDLTYLVNSGQWVFNIHPQYSIALMVYVKGVQADLGIRGPIHGLQEFINLNQKPGVILDRELLLRFTSSGSIPGVSDQETADILTVMRGAKNINEFEGGLVRPVQEFNATADRRYFDHGDGPRRYPVYSGKTFSHWDPLSGELFARADPDIAIPVLNDRMARQLRLRSSAFYGLDLNSDLGGLHPIFRPRIAIRGMTSPTNSRTVIPALIPAHVVLTNISPYLLLPIGREKTEAYLLAVLSSIPFDWYGRKFIESALNFHLFSAFPIPEPQEGKAKDRAIQLSGMLAAVDGSYADWAKAVGVEVGQLKKPLEKEEAIAELDALVAIFYGLDSKQLAHIFSTFHRGWDYSDRLDKVQYFLKEWS